MDIECIHSVSLLITKYRFGPKLLNDMSLAFYIEIVRLYSLAINAACR